MFVSAVPLLSPNGAGHRGAMRVGMCRAALRYARRDCWRTGTAQRVLDVHDGWALLIACTVQGWRAWRSSKHTDVGRSALFAQALVENFVGDLGHALGIDARGEPMSATPRASPRG